MMTSHGDHKSNIDRYPKGTRTHAGNEAPAKRSPRRSWLAGGLVVTLLFAAPVPLEAAETKVKVVTLGDSITRGVRLGVKTEETFSSLLQAELRKRKMDAVVVNAGIGGERTDQALGRLAKGVLAHAPKIAIVMYGTNDSYVDKGAKATRLTVEQYAKNLKELVEKLRKGGASVVLMTPPRWGKKARNGIGENPNVRLEAYVKACREVARETKTPLADHFAHWSKAEAKGTDIAAWTTDQCHPNPRGHRELLGVLLPVVADLLGKK